MNKFIRDSICGDEWQHVLSFLSANELFSQCALVCKEWNGITREKIPLHVNIRGGLRWERFIVFCDKINRERIISIWSDIGPTSGTISNEIVYKAIGSMKNLERIFFKRASFANQVEWGTCLSHLDKMTSLTISDSRLSDITHLKQAKNLTHLSLPSNEISDGGMAILGSMINLSSLDLSLNAITPNSFVHLVSLDKLTYLNTSYQRVEWLYTPHENPFRYISQLVNLHTLDMCHNTLNEEWIKHISILPQLKKIKLSSSGVRKVPSFSHPSLLCGLDFSFNEISEEDTRPLIELDHLKHLDMDRCRLADDTLSRLSVSLESLSLRDCNMTINGVESISKLIHLTHLCIGGSPVGNRAIFHLSKLVQLTSLDVSCCRIDNIEGIDKLTRLIKLDMGECKIGCDGAMHLSKIIGLQSIELVNCGIGTRGVEYISTLPNLKQVNLSRNSITEEAIPYLTNMKNVSTVRLFACPISYGSFHQLDHKRFQFKRSLYL